MTARLVSGIWSVGVGEEAQAVAEVGRKHTEEDQVAVAVAVGARIRATRQLAGLKQIELAKLVGSGPSWVTEIENGEANATLRSLARIAAALGVSLKDLMPGEDPVPIQQSNAELAQMLSQALSLQAAPALRQFLDGAALLIRDLKAALDRAAPGTEPPSEHVAPAEPIAPAPDAGVLPQARRRTRRAPVQ